MAWYLTKGILLAMGCFNIGAALVVAVRYAYVWKRAPSRRSRLLPLHIWTVALSYAIITTLAVTARANGLGEPLVRWVGYGVGVTLGVVAMVVIGALTLRKIEDE